MDKNGLSVSGQYVSAPFYEKSVMDGLIDEIEPKIKMLKIFGSKNIVIGPPGQPKENDRIELIKKMAPVLNEFGKRMLDRGLEIGVHPHLNTLIETSKETDIIMEETDPRYVFMSPDTGHLYLAGGDVLSIFRKFKERLNYFHFKDGVRPFNPPNFKPNLRELGMGDVDFPGIMQLLKEINYTGWINIEQDHSTLTPTESCETSMKYVDQTLRPIYS
jgi:inosose dehydratase